MIKYQDGLARNGDVAIHYIVAKRDSDSSDIAIVVIPGMIESAGDYAGVLAPLLHGQSIYISIRGRGRSGAPDAGYSFDDQVSDVDAVISAFDLDRFILVGHSIGAVFALGYALESPDRVAGLVLSDYGPAYPKYTQAWVDGVLAYEALTMNRLAVRQIAIDGERVDLASRLREITCPVLVTRGGQKGTLLSDAALAAYESGLKDCRVEVLADAAHDPFDPTPDAFATLILEHAARVASNVT